MTARRKKQQEPIPDVGRIGLTPDSVCDAWGLLSPLDGAVKFLLTHGGRMAKPRDLKTLWTLIMATRRANIHYSKRAENGEPLAELDALLATGVAQAFKLTKLQEAVLVELKFAAFSRFKGEARAHLDAAMKRLGEAIDEADLP